MITRILVTGFAVAVAAVAGGAPALAADPPVQAPRATVTDESGCYEIVTNRNVVTAYVDPLVPDRFGLPTTATTQLTILTYTCRHLTVDDQPQVGRDKPTTVTIGLVPVTSVDGRPLVGFNGYLLWYGTDNPVLFAKLHQSGLPASFLPHSITTLPPSTAAPSDATSIDWAIRGSDLTYDLHAVAVEPVISPTDSTIRLHHDTPDGRQLLLQVHNLQAAPPATRTTSTTGQLSGITVLQDLLTDPRFNTIPQPGQVATFSYLRGAWTSELLTTG